MHFDRAIPISDSTRRELTLCFALLDPMSSKRASSSFKLPLMASSPPAKRARLSSPPTAASSSTNTFSPATFLASLRSAPVGTSKQSEQELLELECDSMDPSWLSLLQDEVRRPYFLKLKESLWKEGVKGVGNSTCGGKVFPPRECRCKLPVGASTDNRRRTAKDIYAWSRYTPLHKVKVVIIGQDPYHDDGEPVSPKLLRRTPTSAIADHAIRYNAGQAHGSSMPTYPQLFKSPL